MTGFDVFENAPVSLWEEDFSAVRKRIGDLLSSGVRDFAAYFSEHPAAVAECAALVRLVNTNQESVRLFEAGSKAELLETLPKLLGEAGLPAFRGELIALAQGKTRYEAEAQIRTLRGRPIWIDLTLSLAPGCDQTWERVLVSIRDGTERKRESEQARRTEAALAESEARLRFLTGNMLDMISQVGEDRTFRYVSPSVERVLGFKPEDMLGRNVWELVHPDDAARIVPEVRRQLQEGASSCLLEFRHRNGAGEYVWLEALVTLFRDPRGEFAGAVFGTRNISARKRAEADLRRSEYEKSLILNSTSEMFAFCDTDLRVLWANKASADSAGCTPAEMAGRFCFEIWHSRNAPCETCPVVMARDTGQPQQGEVTTPDGRVFLLRGYPVFDTQGAVVRLVEFRQDITERKRAEAELEKTKALLEAAIEQSSAGIVIADAPDVTIRWANSAALGIRGETDERLTEIPHHLHPSRWRIYRPDGTLASGEELPLSRAVMRGERSRNVELVMQRNDGEKHWILVNAAPVRDSSGAVVAGVGVFTDITDLKAEEERLAQARKMESIGRLAGGVAHDFNNLLTVINGYSHLLLGRLDPASPLRAPLTEIRKAGDRAERLVQQLLAFSRKQMLRPELVNLNQVVREMYGMLARLVGEHILVRCVLAPEIGTVRADPHQLQQVILNLVVNARDAMPRGGCITVQTRNVDIGPDPVGGPPDLPPGGYVSLFVSDTGAGMDEETRRRLFEPFFTTKDVGKGTGLGLSTVHGIIAQSGGQVFVESELGRGTTFQIYLPRQEGAATATPQVLEAQGRAGHETVLVVEDQPDVRDYAAAALEASGYRVLKAGGGAEAVALSDAEPGPIHLLLTDVVMPEMSGRELAARLKARRPSIRVLYMSGYTDEVVSHHGFIEEGTALLQKPFSPDELAVRVREALDIGGEDPRAAF